MYNNFDFFDGASGVQGAKFEPVTLEPEFFRYNSRKKVYQAGFFEDGYLVLEEVLADEVDDELILTELLPDEENDYE